MEKITYISYDNLKTYTDNIKEKLSERISEPEEEGNEGNFLVTDGKGGRYWTELDLEYDECSKEEITEIYNTTLPPTLKTILNT